MPLIILKNLTKKYGDIIPVNQLNLTIEEGEFFGLLGPNGAGKTTTIRMIMALTPPYSGFIKVNGYKADRNNIAFKGQIGFVPQHNNLEPELTVEENLRLHGKLYGLEPDFINKRIKELLDFAQLEDKRDVIANTLSGGMKRKLLVARALMHNPSILLLDEPTVGLDVFARRKVWDLIKGLHKRGKTIILTTHYLEEAEALCTRIGLLKKGKLLMCGTLDELREKVGKVVIETFEHDETILHFYHSQEDALKAASKIATNLNIRQTRLEDVFVKITEEKR